MPPFFSASSAWPACSTAASLMSFLSTSHIEECPAPHRARIQALRLALKDAGAGVVMRG
jgi:hypothetical protein